MNDRRNQYCKINVSGRNPSPKEAQDYVYNVQGYPREKTEEGFFEVKSSSYSERPALTFTQEPQGPAKKGGITITFANKVSVTMHAGFSGRDLCIIGTRKNCHIFHKKRHFKALKA